MTTCDIFCKVIDNYGDAGIAWRLARGLSDTYGFDVRLYIDDSTPLAQLAPDYLRTKISVRLLPLDNEDVIPAFAGIQNNDWTPAFAGVADLIIECLGADVPDSYVQALADRTRTGVHPAPVWIRYEYLTAEGWAADVHKKPSPHPQCPELKRYFFVPGFKDGTGGLLFTPSVSLGGDTSPVKGEDRRASLLFSYGHPELKELYDYLTGQGVRVDLPPGAAVEKAGLAPTVPWRPQDELDQAFFVYNYVFVRGEDSITQAVAAGVPAIWQIYPQDDNAHHVKLAAFLDWYLNGLGEQAMHATRALYNAWNFGDASVVPAVAAWLAHLPALTSQAQKKATEIRARGSACKNLVDFYRQIG